MPKIVVLKKQVVKGIQIVNFLAGGQSTKVVKLWEGEDVTNFSYFDGEEIKKLNGKITAVNFVFKNNAKPQDGKYLITDMASVGNITIDASAEHSANVVTIPKTSVLEYQADAPCDDTDVFPMIKLKLDLLLSNDTKTEIEITEGDEFEGAIYRTTPAPAIVYGNFTVEGFIYTAAGDITGLMLNNGKVTVAVQLSAIKSFGTESTLVVDLEEAANEIDKSASQPGETVVSLKTPGTIDDELTVGNTCIIRGSMVNVPANTGERAKDEIDEETENVFTNKISFNDATNLELAGVTLTGKSVVRGKDLGALSLTNTKVAKISTEGTEDGKYFIYSKTDNDKEAKPVSVNIDGCYFGKCDETHQVYNMIELHAKWTNGSSVRNCTFAGSNTNNAIPIYGVEDGATITIENNHFSDGNFATRIGFVNAPKDVKVYYRNNTYDVCEKMAIGKDHNDYWTMCTIEPMAKKTEDLSGVTIYFEDFTPLADEKPYLIVMGPKDTQLTDAQLPTIYVNGIKETVLNKIVVTQV